MAYGESVERVWRECGESVERVWRECVESVERGLGDVPVRECRVIYW